MVLLLGGIPDFTSVKQYYYCENCSFEYPNLCVGLDPDIAFLLGGRYPSLDSSPLSHRYFAAEKFSAVYLEFEDTTCPRDANYLT